MPTAFIRPSWRRPVAVIALWLVVLQSFLSGVATAQAGAALADPLAAAVICHGISGESDPGAPASPDAGGARHLCCSYCLAAAPALLPSSWQVARADQATGTTVLPLSHFIIVVAREAVRAGPSQAPPGRA